ncbi:MAG: hypothetical protein M3143_04585 [Actinomycetota bacterium]|nr:hypothetical protein [Actinomycetota bacterium]
MLFGAPMVSVGILLIASLAVTGAALSMSCARLGYSQWPAAVSLLVVNPLLISTIGLRTYSGLALVAVLGLAVLAGRPVAIEWCVDFWCLLAPISPRSP